MTNYNYLIARHPNRVLMNAFQEMAIVHTTVIYFNIIGSHQEFSGNDHTLIEEISNQKAQCIASIRISTPNIEIHYYSSGNPSAALAAGTSYDQIQIRQNNHQTPDIEKLFTSINILDSKLGIFKSKSESKKNDLLQISEHSSILSRLEILNEELISKTSNYREELDRNYLEKASNLEISLSEKEERLNSEYESKKDSLEKQEQSLISRLKEIDDRNNTHVRRTLRESLLAEVRQRSERFSLTKTTRNLRTPIHAACILFSVILLVAAYQYAIELFQYISMHSKENLSPIVIALLTIKQVGFTFGFVGIVVFYIRWLNEWFQQHARSEFQLRQFQLDIDRASWAVETTLEWHKSTGSPVPPVLLEAITSGLFSNSDQKESNETSPADHLASALIGTASKVRINTGNADLEFEGKALRKSQQEG